MSTTFTMRMGEDQKELIASYAAMHGLSMAEFMLGATLDVIEDATDLREWKAAQAEFEADPTTVSQAEVMAEFGLL